VTGTSARIGDGLSTLTNSTEQVARAHLEHAGVLDAFELVLSADMVGRLKPAPEPYLLAAERLGVAVGEVRLSRPMPGMWPGWPGRAAPPPSSPAPARS
jgi:haloacid dehalogenase-like hydrolase